MGWVAPAEYMAVAWIRWQRPLRTSSMRSIRRNRRPSCCSPGLRQLGCAAGEYRDDGPTGISSARENARPDYFPSIARLISARNVSECGFFTS